ncbi:MAG TPA: hypothetical protein PKD86_16445 [Gemmatales bacterium]|nr:hypothetical protein [Gemmatales bacterium]
MGDGRGQPSKRMARKDRWIIVLPLQDHAQFMRKLAELQTIILVPDAPGRFRLYTAWSSGQAPVHTVVTVEGIRDLNRIWYTNTDAEVCVGVAKQLGLDTTPNYIAIFVPQELEREMAKKELEYRQLSEEQIVQEKLETVFDVMRSGAQFVVKVREQKPRSQ